MGKRGGDADTVRGVQGTESLAREPEEGGLCPQAWDLPTF